MSGVRIDKWLWSVRVFKTRSQAADACKKNRVWLNDQLVKASREVKINDVIRVYKPPIELKYKVVALLHTRVGAKLVANYMENITPQEQYEILKMHRLTSFSERAKGLGRPTKKDRRDIDQFSDELLSDTDLFDWDEDWDFSLD